MENFTKNVELIDLKLPATLLGFFVLFIISIFMVYSLLADNINEYEIIIFLVALFLFVYSIFMSINLIDKVIFKNGSIILKKKFKQYDLKNISFISIIKIRLINVIVVRFIIDEKKKITGYYFYQKPSHEKFMDLLQRLNISYRIKTV